MDAQNPGRPFGGGRRILHRMLEEGHEIANHGDLDHKACLLNNAKFYASLDDCASILKDAWNVHAKKCASLSGGEILIRCKSNLHNSRPNNYYRPGGGFYHGR